MKEQGFFFFEVAQLERMRVRLLVKRKILKQEKNFCEVV